MMDPAVRIWGVLALIVGLGLACTVALDPGRASRMRPVALLGQSIVLGWAVLGMAWFWQSLAGVPLGPLCWVLPVGLTVALAGLAKRRGAGQHPWRPLRALLGQRGGLRRLLGRARGGRAPRGWRSWHELVALACTVALVGGALAVTIAHAVGLPLFDWDSVAIWAFKARVMMHDPVSTAWALRAPEYGFSHLDYPLVVPAVLGGTSALVGEALPDIARAVFPLLYLGMALMLYGELRPRGGRWVAGGLTALLVWTPTVLRHAGASTADIPLGAFILAATIAGARALTTRRASDRLLTVLFAACIWQTKQEGMVAAALVMAIAACLAALPFPPAHREPVAEGPREGRHTPSTAARRLLPWTLAGVGLLALVLPWLWLRHSLPASWEDYSGNLGGTGLARAWSRVGPTLDHTWMLLTSPRWFGYTWRCLPLVALLGWRGFRQPAILLGWGVLLGQLAADIAAYAVSPWKIDEHLHSSEHRLLAQLTPLVVWLVGRHLIHWLQRPRRLSAAPSAADKS